MRSVLWKFLVMQHRDLEGFYRKFWVVKIIKFCMFCELINWLFSVMILTFYGCKDIVFTTVMSSGFLSQPSDESLVYFRITFIYFVIA